MDLETMPMPSIAQPGIRPPEVAAIRTVAGEIVLSAPGEDEDGNGATALTPVDGDGTNDIPVGWVIQFDGNQNDDITLWATCLP